MAGESIDREFAAAGAALPSDGGKALVALLDRIRKPYPNRIAICESAVPAGFAVLARAVLAENVNALKAERRASFLAELVDESAGKSLLAKSADSLAKAANAMIGTHTAKIPNPETDGAAALMRDATLPPPRDPFISGRTTGDEEILGGAGNAADARAQRFLITPLTIGNQATTVLAEIRAGSAIAEALVKAGLPEKTVNLIRTAEPADAPVPLGAKTILWPVDSSYIQITPVHSYRMFMGMTVRRDAWWDRRRASERPKDMRLLAVDVYVGGSKPQNAGLLNSDFGGRHTFLRGLPPKSPIAGSSDDRLLYRLRHLRSLLGIRLDKQIIKSFDALASRRGFDNVQARTALVATTSLAAAQVAADLLRVRQLIERPADDSAASVRHALETGDRTYAKLDAAQTAFCLYGFDGIEVEARTSLIDSIFGAIEQAFSKADGLHLDDEARASMRPGIELCLRAAEEAA